MITVATVLRFGRKEVPVGANDVHTADVAADEEEGAVSWVGGLERTGFERLAVRSRAGFIFICHRDGGRVVVGSKTGNGV